MAKKGKNKAPKQRDIDRLAKYEDEGSRSVADDMLTDAVADLLRSGPYPPIQFRPLPSLNMMSLLGGISRPINPPEPTDCVRETWQDREQTQGYVYNAYVSARQEANFGAHYEGIVTSVVEPPVSPSSGSRPIAVSVIHNIDGTPRLNNTYLSIESAKQLVNQIGQAISVAEARTEAKA